MTTPPSESGEPLLDGRYRLGERLGGGAVADVFRALDERLQRPVAVKVFRGDAAEQLHRHEAEMRTLAALDHPSLVTVFDAGTDEPTGRPFLVMQLVEGPTLGGELRAGGFTPERAARYGAELADALEYVHERGLVHRDVKPANVLLSDDGRVHLADFGIARLVDSAHETKTGDVLGTPAYFAPEQVAGETVGPPADIYALGIVLFECLTGRRPFEGTVVEVAMARIARDPDIPTDLPTGWQQLLAAMTRREPAARPTAAQVAGSLRRLAAGEPVDPTVVAGAAASPAETTVMPPVAVQTQAMRAPAATTVTPAPVGRRGPARALIVVMLLVVVAVAAAVLVAVQRSGNGSGGAVKHGTPHLHQPLERDVRHLENLVQP
ncbi:MAG TPA: protein kinase [Mycobacteriales bacterium]|nr:protein kinase [Mycobacteriales bacterium]